MNPHLPFLLSGVAFIVFGTLFAWASAAVRRRSRDLLTWPTTAAVLTHCELLTETNSEDLNRRVVVRYEYEVSGTKFSADTIHPSYSAGSSAEQQELYDKLSRCSRVRVRYRENDPQQAYLLAGEVGTDLTGIFTGLVCVVIGVELVLLACIYGSGHTSYVSGLDVVR